MDGIVKAYDMADLFLAHAERQIESELRQVRRELKKRAVIRMCTNEIAQAAKAETE